MTRATSQGRTCRQTGKLAKLEILFDYAEMTGRTQLDILREFIRSLDVRKKRHAAKPTKE